MPVSVSKRIWKPFTKYVCISVFSPVDLALPFKETSILETLSWQANAGVCLRTLAGFFFLMFFPPLLPQGINGVDGRLIRYFVTLQAANLPQNWRGNPVW